MIDRQKIINGLSEDLRKNKFVLAMWLEGADATNNIDQYSDIDVWFRVKTGQEKKVMESIEGSLRKIGPLDMNIDLRHPHPDIMGKVFHLKNSSKYLLIDTFIESDRREIAFINNFGDENPQILFDKENFLRFKELDRKKLTKELAARRKLIQDVLAQNARTESKVRRGSYLEAIYYYHKWIMAFLVECLRVKYTPLKRDYYLKHAYRDFPPKVCQRLEGLYSFHNMPELKKKISQAYKWCLKLIEDKKIWKK